MEDSLSIIISTYNESSFVEFFINSVIKLIGKNKHCEIICIDDGSTDGTKEKIINIFEENKHECNIKCFFVDHKGVSYARNIGIINSKNNYLWFVDSDDEILCQSLNDILNKINLNNDVICFSARVYNCYPEISKIKDLEFNNNVLEKNIFNRYLNEYYHPYVWNCIFKKSFLLENNLFFDENVSIGEDALFKMLVFYKAKNIKFSNTFVYKYNYLKNKKSVISSSLKSDILVKNHLYIIDKVFEQLRFDNNINFNYLNVWAYRLVDTYIPRNKRLLKGISIIFKKYKIRVRNIGFKKYIKSIIYSKYALLKLFVKIKFLLRR